MGRKVLLAVIYCLTLSQTLGEPGNENKHSAVPKDNESAASNLIYHRKEPFPAYAGGVPHFPQTYRGQMYDSSRQGPVNTNSNLNAGLMSVKDSYGKFVQENHAAYKPSYPQQFVALQDLPPHLAKPLASAAAPSFKFNGAPQFAYGPQSYKVQEVQIPPSQASQFGSISQPLVYANDLKNFGQINKNKPIHELITPEHKLTITSHDQAQREQQKAPDYFNKQTNLRQHSIQHSNQKPYISYQQAQNSQHQNYPSTVIPYHTTHHALGTNLKMHNLINELIQNFRQKSSKLKPSSSTKDANKQARYHQAGPIQASPAQTTVTAIVNGKETVVNLETKPPVPQLDLNLLEPLKFDNPLVPQLQHYLPKVEGATYHKFPKLNSNKDEDENKKYVITKTKSNKIELVEHKINKSKNHNKHRNKPSKPDITVKGDPNSRDFSYEINTPNHKETYNEQVVKYNKETNMKPVEYSYDEKTSKEPEVYTYVHSSKEPLKVTHVEYNSDDPAPKHHVYHSYPEDKEDEQGNKAYHAIIQAYEEASEEVSNSSESEEHGLCKDPLNNKTLVSCKKLGISKNNQQIRHHNNESPKHIKHHPEQDSIVYSKPTKDQHHNSEHPHDSSKHSSHSQPNHQHVTSSKHSKHNNEYISHHKNPEQDSVVYGKPTKDQHHNSEHPHDSPKHSSHSQQNHHHVVSSKHSKHNNEYLSHHENPEQDSIVYGKPTKDQHHNSKHHHDSQKHSSQSQPNHQDVTSPKYSKHIEHHYNEYNPHNENPENDPIIYGIPTKDQHHHHDSRKHSSHSSHSQSNRQDETSPKHSSQPPYYVKSHNLIVPHTPEIKGIQETPNHVYQYKAEPREYENNLNSPPNFQILPNQNQVVQSLMQPNILYQTITPEYEEVIRVFSTHNPHSAPIKVDPNQHISGGRSTPQTFFESHPNKNAGEEQGQQFSQPQFLDNLKTHKSPDDTFSEEMGTETLHREENNEEDFEKAYKESAHGFPAYETVAGDIEKDIFDPDSYGSTPHYPSESLPFQEFEKNGDKFSKFSRLDYKDSRDSNQEDYFQDYVVHKPESYTDRIKSKVNYYKMFKENRPKQMYLYEGDENKGKSAKFTIAPTFDFFSSTSPKTKKSKFVQYKVDPPTVYGYDPSEPGDNKAFPSSVYSNNQKSHFVVPKIQYGFHPITAPVLFVESDVESDNNPESENLGTRKKVYREKLFMKKVSTNSNLSKSDS